MTTYIDLYGGPGTGKSTLAAGLFYRLKEAGYSVELVTEYAKDLVWENRADTLKNQPYISMKQFRNLSRLAGKVDLVVTDSPLLKDLVYARMYASELPNEYYTLIRKLHDMLGAHINILLERTHVYDTVGRLQDADTAIDIDSKIKSMLAACSQSYQICNSTEAAFNLVKTCTTL